MSSVDSGGKLTTHVLDTATGCPAADLKIELFNLDDATNAGKQILTTHTNADGRCDAPLLHGEGFKPGRYELRFYVSAYFEKHQVDQPSGQFLDVIPVQFVIADEASHYHVPLLVSPYSYSTYRGS